jgi:hypothetical protein
LIMGDGSFHPQNGGLLLCTDSYTVQDVVNLQNVLIIRYNLYCSLRLHNMGQYRVYIYKKSISTLSSIVRPHMVPSMLYKIGLNSELSTPTPLQGGKLSQTPEGRDIFANIPRQFSTQANVKVVKAWIHDKPLYSNFRLISTSQAYNNAKNWNPGNVDYTVPRFGPYLAGLIEAIGSIAVHAKDSKVKRYCPRIIVVFSLADKPLAERLAFITQTGKVYYKEDAGYLLWQIQKKEDVIKIINLINGYMRTPKIEALHRAINWFNQFDNCNIDCLGLDNSPIDSNGWLAGFSDGESGGFYSSIITGKKSSRWQLQFKLGIKQVLPNTEDGESQGSAYFTILSKICEYWKTSLISKTICRKEKIQFIFKIIVHGTASLNVVMDYFDKFPLLGKKLSDYVDWREFKFKNLELKSKKEPLHLSATQPAHRTKKICDKIRESSIIGTNYNLYMSDLHLGSKRSYCTQVAKKSLKVDQKLSQCTDLVVWGANLPSLVGTGRLTKKVRDLIKLPTFQYSVVIGLLLSDGWLTFSTSHGKSARLGFGQSGDHSEYFCYCFA